MRTFIIVFCTAILLAGDCVSTPAQPAVHSAPLDPNCIDATDHCGLCFRLSKDWSFEIPLPSVRDGRCEFYLESTLDADAHFHVIVYADPWEEALKDAGFFCIEGQWMVAGRGYAEAQPFSGRGWEGLEGNPTIGIDTGGHGMAAGDSYRAILRFANGAVVSIDTAGLWNEEALRDLLQSLAFTDGADCSCNPEGPPNPGMQRTRYARR